MSSELRDLILEIMDELEREFKKRRISELPKEVRYFEALRAIMENKKLRKLLFLLSVKLLDGG